MPELPEVEALASNLRTALVPRRIERVDITSVAALKTFDPPLAALTGLPVHDVRRLGKHLDLEIGEFHVVIHLARAGWLRVRELVDDKPVRPGKGPLAARFRLEGGGVLDITDAASKKKVAISVVRDPSEVESVARLGVDPLSADFTLAAFERIVTDNERRQLKGLLRDQRMIAGIGNAYSDEILHVARLSPFAMPSSLDGGARAALHDVIVSTLSTAVEQADGLEPDKLKDGKRRSMRVHGRTGQACPECGDTIREVSFSDSSLQYCPTCQTAGKPLKDRRMSKLLK